MNEAEFRNAYNGFNPDKCVYEKAILTQHCSCTKAKRINLAERQGIGCTDLDALSDCSIFLNSLRQHAKFALKLTAITGNLLPHSKEVKVQKGGLLSFFPELENKTETRLDNIYAIIQKAKQQAQGNFEAFPYSQCIPAISQFEIVKRTKRKLKKDHTKKNPDKAK